MWNVGKSENARSSIQGLQSSKVYPSTAATWRVCSSTSGVPRRALLSCLCLSVSTAPFVLWLWAYRAESAQGARASITAGKTSLENTNINLYISIALPHYCET